MHVRASANVIKIGHDRRPLGLSAIGVAGSTWATLIGCAVTLALLLRMLWRGCSSMTIGGAVRRLHDAHVARCDGCPTRQDVLVQWHPITGR
jgi:hypothetical protein